MICGWYCKEKLHVSHSLESNGNITSILIPFQVKEILELSPSLQNTPDVLLGLCNMKTTEGRQLCAKALCNSI